MKGMGLRLMMEVEERKAEDEGLRVRVNGSFGKRSQAMK